MEDGKAARTWGDLTEAEKRASAYCCAYGDCLRMGTVEVLSGVRDRASLCAEHIRPTAPIRAASKRRARRS